MSDQYENIEAVAAHPLFIVADSIVSHIHDYPSLICYVMVCRRFRDSVYSQKALLEEAFDRLEVCRSHGEVYTRNKWLDTTYHTRQRRCCHQAPSCRCCHQVPSWRKCMHCFISDNKEWAYDHDIFRFNCSQLRSLSWFPCYGCRVIKQGSKAFHERRGLITELSQQRRCIECCLKDKEILQNGEFPHETENQRRSLLAQYLMPMYEIFKGLRLRCSHCRKVEFITRRPCAKQKVKQMCSTCYAKSLQPQPLAAEVFREEWLRLLEIECEVYETESIEDDDTTLSNDLEALSSKTMYRFDILEILDLEDDSKDNELTVLQHY